MDNLNGQYVHFFLANILSMMRHFNSPYPYCSHASKWAPIAGSQVAIVVYLLGFTCTIGRFSPTYTFAPLIQRFQVFYRLDLLSPHTRKFGLHRDWSNFFLLSGLDLSPSASQKGQIGDIQSVPPHVGPICI